jgi:hypothetical protein
VSDEALLLGLVGVFHDRLKAQVPAFVFD